MKKTFEFEGKTFKFIENGSITGDGTRYQAKCFDMKTGTNHIAYWDILDSYDDECDDESRACDWEEIAEVLEGYTDLKEQLENVFGCKLNEIVECDGKLNETLMEIETGFNEKISVEDIQKDNGDELITTAYYCTNEDGEHVATFEIK